MLRFKFLAGLFALALLSGCASGYDIERARGLDPQGVSAFNAALTQEYQQLSAYEADEMYDWPDAEMFARKAIAAANGDAVMPEELADWDLPADTIGELTSARAEMMGLFDQGAREKAPEEAAHAQGRFDCWVEQQEENHQPEHIAACRQEFLDAMAALRAAMAPMPKAAEPMPMAAPEPYVVYFDFDRSDLRTDAMDTLKEALSAAQRLGMIEVSVTGHADRAGPDDYNLGLSLHRAEAVRDWFAGKGILPQNISIAGRGESEPAVATADGAREQRNRRVVIILQ
jgi:OOP family OmpA-OmpF porin